MEKKFEVTKEQRKALVAAIGDFVGRKPAYQGAPSFAFVVGDFTVDRNGTLIYDEQTNAVNVQSLLTALAEQGFVFEGGIDKIASGADVDSGNFSVNMPLTGFTAPSLDNLEKLVAAKAWILKKMTGADELPIERDEEQLRFPWFKRDASAAEVDAYSCLIAGLCETAKKKQRVMAAEHRLEDGDNEKFKARCFLLSLNFIGEESAQARKILLAPMNGSGSHKRGDSKRDKTTQTPLPLKCGECLHHCYYTEGLLRTSAGDIVDTSKRTPDHYTHYCLNTPSGFRRIKHAVDWTGSETAPQWCPLSAKPKDRTDSHTIADSGENNIKAVSVREGDSGADSAATGGEKGAFRDCLACANAMSEPAAEDGEFDRLFCVVKQDYVSDNSSCGEFNS